MKTIKKNVYYCDYCKKKSLNAAVIKKHENVCTLNPDRECSICRANHEVPIELYTIIPELKKRFTLRPNPDFDITGLDEFYVDWIGEPITMKEIIKIGNNCPSCILSILRQAELNRYWFKLEPYDYKKEMEKVTNEIRSNRNLEYYDNY